MSSPLHSTVTNKPRTLPACFASSCISKKTADVRSEALITSEIQYENGELGTSPDCSSIRQTDPVKDDENASSTSTAQAINEVKTEEIPLEECDTDVDESPSERKPVINHSASVDNGEVSSTETLPLSTVFTTVVDNPVVSSVSSSGNDNAEKRLGCRYGASCYRRNVQHKEEFSHPGDVDYSDGEARCSSTTDVNANKPSCWYGARCYRKNKEHLENFSHCFSSSGRPIRMTQIRVEIQCDSDESEELEDFHTDSDEYEASFIDDDGSTDDDIDSEEDAASEMSADSNTSGEEADKKRKKKVSKKSRKKKI